MAITAYTAKYHDDINTADSSGLTPLDKNYLRILFQPGRSVQARELNQAQSLLQTQLDRLGQSLFRPNAPIVGGNCNFDTTLRYVDIIFDDTITFNDVTALLTITSLTDLSISDSESTFKASIHSYEKLNNTNLETGGEYRFFIHYTSDDQNENISGFTGNISLYDDISRQEFAGRLNASGKAVCATLENGIYFVKGCVAQASAQSVTYALEPGEDYFSGYAVLRITESTVSHTQDITLLDNAAGTPNYAGIGADRYQLDLKLELVENYNEDVNYIILLKISDSQVISKSNPLDTSGSTLEKILAKRTFEESGDYTVRPFDIELAEVWGGSTYKGRYKNEIDLNDIGLTTTSAVNHYACTLSPSVAYVKGSRVELPEAYTIIGDKARETWLERNGSLYPASITADLGTYVVATLSGGIPNLDSFNSIYNIQDATPATIGTCKIQSIEKVGSRYRIYLHSISFEESKTWNDAVTIEASAFSGSYGTALFTIISVEGEKLQQTQIDSSLFRLPFDNISLVSSLNITEKQNFYGQVGDDGTITFSAPGKAFDKSPSNIIVAVEKTSGIFEILSAEEYEIVAQESGDILTLDFNVGDTPIFGVADADLNDGEVVSIIASVTYNISGNLGVKTLTTETVNITQSDGSDPTIYDLEGVYHLVSVNSDEFEIEFDGQTPTEYQTARVRSIIDNSPLVTTSVQVTHWKISSGENNNYFTVNSYRDSSGKQIPLSNIPFYRGERLSEYIDTRQAETSNNRLALDSYSPITANINFYLPRKDLVCVNNVGDFFILKGNADLNPVYPQVPNDAMILHRLDLKAYTFSINDITAMRINTRRYTMRDIGDIADRVGKLEYYVTLSQLEKAANETNIYDEDGTARFKNGYIVDAFRNHLTGDVGNKLYRCSVDRTRGILYPYHTGYNVSFNFIENDEFSSSDEYDYPGISSRTLCLPYNEVEYINQPFASQFISVQPHAFAPFIGTVELYPEVDIWNDTTTAPPVVVDDIFSGFTDIVTALAADANLTGTDWGNWTTTTVRGELTGRNRWQRRMTTTTARTGVTTEIVQDEINQSLGRYVSDVSIRPYMRSRVIFFEAKGLKPNARYYAYFDGINVSSFAGLMPAGLRRLNLSVFIEGYNQNLDDGLDTTTLLSRHAPSELISDDNGILRGRFILPNTNTLKFGSGEKVFKLTDSPRNVADETTSFASAKYISNGLNVTTNETVISTNVPRIERTTVTESRTREWLYDPIAQTFTVEDSTGIFASSLEIFFAEKPIESNKAPVQAYLVTTNNGYPTQEIIPGSEVTLSWDEVITNPPDAPVTPTVFKFTDPIYLNPKTEYAIVVFSPSPDYKAFIAEMGGASFDLLTGQIISSQVGAGVFFTSSNKSTWSAYQNRDLTFKLNRASFEVKSAVAYAYPYMGTGIKNVEILDGKSGFIPLQTNVTFGVPTVTVGENVLTVDGGIAATGTAIIEPLTGTILGVEITSKGWGYVENPTITITDGTTTIESTAGECIGNLEGVNVGACNVNIKDINISNYTNVSAQLRLDTNTYAITPGQPLEEIKNPKYQITANNSGTTGTTELSITLSTTDERLSPFVDLSTLSVETREYFIAPPTSSEENTSRYYTKRIELTNPADQIDGYISVNLPTRTSGIEVYIQLYDTNGDLIPSDEGEWWSVEPNTPSVIPVNSDRSRYDKVRFTRNFEEYNIQYNSFIIKVVFRGENYNDVPSLRDFVFMASV